ncbi:MAG: hypothetical protein ACRDP4_07975 [Nocardioidaceae bacterium]
MTRYRTSCDVCGWTSKLHKGRKGAGYAYRRHSCDRHRSRAASKARRLAREAALDRTPKPCLHKQTSHVHGTHACYVLDRCRCHQCVVASSAYETARVRQHAYGRWDGLVDAGPAREHVLRLMAAGVGLKRVARLAGVSHGGLSKLIYGNHGRPPSARIRPAAAEKLLATRADLAVGTCVDATGTRHRLRALVALGWSQSKLAAELDMQPGNVGHLLQHQAKVQKRTATSVAALYDRLSMTLPPADTHRDKIAASRARNYARARGWLPPLAWDDDQLDTADPHPRTSGHDPGHDGFIDDAAVERRMTGDRVRLTPAEATETIARMRGAGHSLAHIGRITGLKVERYYNPRRRARGGGIRPRPPRCPVLHASGPARPAHKGGRVTVAFCRRCKPPKGLDAVIVYATTGPTQRRSAAACERHKDAVHTWVAQAGGPVTETPLHPEPASPSTELVSVQTALF